MVELIAKKLQLLVFICFAVASGAAQQSVRNVDWMNYSYPFHVENVPGEVQWSSPGTTTPVTLVNGKYVIPDCSEHASCPLLTFDSVKYGALNGKSTAAAVVLRYFTGGTAHWEYVYLFAFETGRPRLLAWLRTGSRGAQGLRDVSFTGGDFVLVINDPAKQMGDCCSAGTITTHYRWAGTSFSPIGRPVYKNDPPSFDCTKAATPVERLICQDAELSSLDSQMANSYRMVLNGASAEQKMSIRRKQAEWFAEYRRTCNAAATDAERRDCIDRHLSDRLMTIWK